VGGSPTLFDAIDVMSTESLSRSLSFIQFRLVR